MTRVISCKVIEPSSVGACDYYGTEFAEDSAEVHPRGLSRSCSAARPVGVLVSGRRRVEHWKIPYGGSDEIPWGLVVDTVI